ncbi:DUF262 domain-containing protein [Vibrio cholerae]|uniref:DUF262 domain-containing protein n=1 Tax=Vibrio cholerae TaxID=666 RepID=UPI0011DB2001|nr:DUF262 domain-containing protein [Vibrio cholerae]EGR3627460.1 DUF262 domain-containing protein [Vibrio cholerae]EGR3851899.1 DUF262 domain-containing protein [Vibrio cholerae]EGR4214216.1 DUF262 domain-containing protein [Vibrio cholerae]EGR4481638.1 DUF262 domain-containing protein [Vibrio cholerae]EJK2385208.1 DUF262 domain-containing protein [Vibrio cholerae]
MSETPAIDSNLCLKSVYELLNEDFFIPAYQRGYRWGESQVKALLNDIWEFARTPSDKQSAFYCLQPVVVVRNDDNWHVVDGQQRLTTLFLLLRYFEIEHLRDSLERRYKKRLYSLAYETRPNCQQFLQNIHEDSHTDNIDFFHMHEAFQTIKNWFSDKDYSDQDDFMKVLLEKASERPSVKVIWYDLTGESADYNYAIDVFARINIGKIPLTNAELIKALFLKSSNFNEKEANLKQLQIASEWDQIEKRLQEPSFWYFINDSGRDYATRIEYAFDLMKNNQSSQDPFSTFIKFQDDLQVSGKTIDQVWKEVKDYFMTLDEWYQDRELYHLIGFLVTTGCKVAGLKAIAHKPEMTKTLFKQYLRALIKQQFTRDVDDLNYDEHAYEIRKLLLLFNIQTLLSTSNADIRFPFDRFKKEQWDIEHIRSKADRVPKGKEQKLWLEDLGQFLSTDPNAITFFIPADELNTAAKMNPKVLEDAANKVAQLVERIEPFKSDNESSQTFEAFYNEINTLLSQQSVDWVDDLGNLALLDASTNRSYKSAIFPIKRARIIENDSFGIFIPICTKNAFLKYYSKSYNELAQWGEDDANDYVAAIKQVLAGYLPQQGAANE